MLTRPFAAVTTKLKDFFDEDVVRSTAADLRRAYPSFRTRSFVQDCLGGLDDLELTARARHIARIMQDHLPSSFAVSAEILVDSLGPELERTEGHGLAPFRYLPHVFFVERYGLDDFDSAMRAQYELTKRFTAEWSIRAFLLRYPARTYEQLMAWTEDANVHVRRLVSEGTRPRLPWAPRLRVFQADPLPVLTLLDRLKDDPERYVQRSVANNLNDVGKDHPDLAVATCRRWLQDPTPSRTWVVGHALRHLVKARHPGALQVLGAGTRPRVRIEQVRCTPRRPKIGDTVQFSARLVSTSNTAQELIVDYAVHFVKANGSSRPKVFKLRMLRLEARAVVELHSSVSLAQMTTRRHYPGRHEIELIVNGVGHPLATFQLRT